ncbi:major facilitator superfamily transporter [Trematosphaeria pertusa]|uniref:Major facilitator superfamily transporter n=1 Tax=Trematosphaeria pertusa TaxID=390896 RepID=A0A6A6J4Q8_9PLEO|nr:major facilitator superfamily transporter [Trematosphaeria pertusa]KAF2256473.1 major facilitator superfamily transporter [Trematosphaeria pertusa]
MSQLQRDEPPSYEQHPPPQSPGDGGPPGSSEPTSYPSAAKTAVIMFSLYISIFLVALDRTIIGPAIPEITNKFHSLDDVGWYGSAYMLTSCGFILLYGRVYTFFPTKTVFLSGIFMFEAGSAVCGAATSSLMLIIGRAIAGFGSSGIFTGAILIMLNTVPLHKRPMLQGLFGACFGVASVTGPLLGGAFTGSAATWRWCFYINLPLGGITILVVVLLLHLEEHKPRMETWMETIKHLDPVGTVLFLPAITCLLLALEWGAAEYPWSDPRIIALLTAFAVLFMAFIAWQYFTRKTTATVPARILFQRSVAFGGLSQFCVGATMLTVSMYVPLWFQAIKEVSAMKSGIDMIPLVLSVVVGSISSGALVQRVGYYTPFMIVGSCLMAVGAGLITTWNMGTKSGEWIGFQVILGLGVGWTMQHPNLAVQIVLAKQDVPTGTALLSLCQTLGGAVFVAVGQNVFIDKFTSGLEQIHGINPEKLASAGATQLKNLVPAQFQHRVLEAYNNSLTQGVFFAAMIVACLALPGALGMEWRSVKENQQPPQRRVAEDDVEKLGPEAIRQPLRPDADRKEEPERSDTPELESLAPPVPAWRKIYRSSGQFSQWMTARVNPDLRDELDRAR